MIMFNHICKESSHSVLLTVQIRQILKKKGKYLEKVLRAPIMATPLIMYRGIHHKMI